MRERRIENEWKLLQKLAGGNPGTLEILERAVGSAGEFFRVRLHGTTSPIKTNAGIELRQCHQIEFGFPRFFPAVPIEANLQLPVFHPNVDPDNGFVCLWSHTCAGDTIVDAVTRLQRIIAWDLVNFAPDHMMQRDAVNWYRNDTRTIALPCPFEAIAVPESLLPAGHSRDRLPAQRRQRLSC